MKKEINTSIRIKASAEKIWSILSNFNEYPNWNPFIKQIEKEVQIGNKIKVKITPPDSKGMTFTPIVLTFEKNKSFSWKGNLLFKGIFDGEHKFTIQENGDGTCTFIHSEKFSGILVGIFNLDKTTQGFNSMNEKLKELAEK